MEHRAEVMQVSGREKRWGDTPFLWGGWSGLKKDGELSKWKANLQAVAVAIRFTLATGRLTSIESDESSKELHSETPKAEEVSEEEREEGHDSGIKWSISNKRRKLARHYTAPYDCQQYTLYLSSSISPLHRLLTPINSPTELGELNKLGHRRDGIGRLTHKFFGIFLTGGAARYIAFMQPPDATSGTTFHNGAQIRALYITEEVAAEIRESVD